MPASNRFRTLLPVLLLKFLKLLNPVTSLLSYALFRAGFSLNRALIKKMWGPSLIYEYRPTEFTRHAR